MYRKFSLIAVAVASATAIATAGATASASPSPDAPSPTLTVRSDNHAVHLLLTPGSTSGQLRSAADERQGSPPLTFHGGPIMKVEKSYAIFWDPGQLQDGSATTGINKTYKSLLKRYFTDVNGTKLWRNNNQYTSGGDVPHKTAYADTWIDQTPFPTGSCVNPDTGINCVTDQDIIDRVVADAAAHGITKSTSKQFFVYTPQDEGSCFDSTCLYGSYSYYCAYHGYIPNDGGSLIYANMPFPTVSSGNNCYYAPGGPQQFPNDLNADAQINVTSHEQIEAVTDPLIDAWYDAAGYEISDECAWNFGPTLPNGGDVTLSGHPYGVQKEASNLSANCLLKGP